MAGSVATTFITLIAVSWALLAAWIGLFLTGGLASSGSDDSYALLPFVLAPGLPFLAGAVWSAVSPRRHGVFVWPVVVTVGVWELLVLAMLIVLALPMLGAAMGAHTGLSRGVGQFAPAVPLVVLGMAVTWATAGWLCRSVPECVPPINAAYIGMFAMAGIVAMVFASVGWQAHLKTEEFRTRDAVFAVEVRNADALVAELKNNPPDAAATLRSLAQSQIGYDRIQRLSGDGTVSVDVRAHAIAQMLATYKDVNPSTLDGAAQMLRSQDPEIRLVIVDALPSTPFSAPSVPLLGSVLEDPDARVRMRAGIKLVSIHDQIKHEYWDKAFRQLQIELQALPDNPSMTDQDVRCGLYRLSIYADIAPLLDYILEDPALSPRHRTMMTNWRTFLRDSNPNKVAPSELYEGCA